MGTVDELLERLAPLPEKDARAVRAKVVKATASMRWIPNAGTQTDAYRSIADVLLYGGRAGGGKTHMELGWAVNEAESAIIFRRKGDPLGPHDVEAVTGGTQTSVRLERLLNKAVATWRAALNETIAP